MAHQSDRREVQDRLRHEGDEAERRQDLSALADEAAARVRTFWGSHGPLQTTTQTERRLWAHAIVTMVAAWRDDGREPALRSLAASYAESLGYGPCDDHKQLLATANRSAATVFNAAIARKSHRHIATILKEAERAGIIFHLCRSLYGIAAGDSCDNEPRIGRDGMGPFFQRMLAEEAARFAKQERPQDAARPAT